MILSPSEKSTTNADRDTLCLLWESYGTYKCTVWGNGAYLNVTVDGTCNYHWAYRVKYANRVAHNMNNLYISMPLQTNTL